MERQATIIDASVALKWFLSEPGSKSAAAALSEHIEGKRILIAPDLLLVEMGNALHYRKMSFENIKRVFQDMMDFQIEWKRLTASLTVQAANAAHRYGLTVYDGVYAALSESLGIPLLTADTALAKIPTGVQLLGS